MITTGTPGRTSRPGPPSRAENRPAGAGSENEAARDYDDIQVFGREAAHPPFRRHTPGVTSDALLREEAAQQPE